MTFECDLCDGKLKWEQMYYVDDKAGHISCIINRLKKLNRKFLLQFAKEMKKEGTRHLIGLTSLRGRKKDKIVSYHKGRHEGIFITKSPHRKNKLCAFEYGIRHQQPYLECRSGIEYADLWVARVKLSYAVREIEKSIDKNLGDNFLKDAVKRLVIAEMI